MGTVLSDGHGCGQTDTHKHARTDRHTDRQTREVGRQREREWCNAQEGPLVPSAGTDRVGREEEENANLLQLLRTSFPASGTRLRAAFAVLGFRV